MHGIHHHHLSPLRSHHLASWIISSPFTFEMSFLIDRSSRSQTIFHLAFSRWIHSFMGYALGFRSLASPIRLVIIFSPTHASLSLHLVLFTYLAQDHYGNTRSPLLPLSYLLSLIFAVARTRLCKRSVLHLISSTPHRFLSLNCDIEL